MSLFIANPAATATPTAHLRRQLIKELAAGEGGIRTVGPSRKGVAFSASHHAEVVDDHPSAFQIGEHSIRPKELREQPRQRFSPDPSP
jgi:hypothetical protein